MTTTIALPIHYPSGDGQPVAETFGRALRQTRPALAAFRVTSSGRRTLTSGGTP